MDGQQISEPLITKYLSGFTMHTSLLKMDSIMREFRTWNSDENIPFRGHGGAVWSCAMTEDNGYIFSGSEDNKVRIWDGLTQECIGILEGHTNCVNGLELTKDDEYLLSGGWDNRVIAWDWKNKVKKADLVGHTGGVYCFAKTHDGRYLVSGGGDSTARIWDLSDFSLIGTLSCDGNAVFGIGLTSDYSEVVCGGSGGYVRIFNFKSQQRVNSFNADAGIIQCLTVTKNNSFIVLGTRNNIVKVFNYKDKTEVAVFRSHQNWVRNIVSTPDSQYFITVSADKSIRIFNLISLTEELGLEGSEGYVFGLCLSKDGQYLLTGASDKIMRKWKIGTIIRKRYLNGHEKCIMSIAVSKDDKYIISSSEDKSVRVWSIEENIEIANLQGHTETVWGVCITDDMKYIASAGGDKSVILWDFESKSKIESLNGHKNSIFCITATHDSKYLVTGSQDKNLMMWDIEKQSSLAIMEGHTDTIFTVKVSNDDKLIVSGAADYTIRIWDTDKREQIQKIETKAGMIESVAISIDDKYLVLGDRSNGVHIWDWKLKKSIKRFGHHTKWVKCVNFSPDGKIFASASNDMTVRLWNADEERHEIVLKGHTSTIRSVCFTNDGKYVISAGEDMKIILWDIGNLKPMELADFGGSLDTFLYLTKIKNRLTPTPAIAQSVFGDLKINLAHFYSYMNYADLLRETLNNGTEIRLDEEGHSPLFYALNRNSQNAVDCLLNYMIELKNINFENFLNYTYAMRNEFMILLDNYSSNLPEFLDTIFYTVPNKPNFAVPKEDLPILHYSDVRSVNSSNFIFDLKDVPEGSEEIPIEFKTLPFAIPYTSGSSASVDLLDSIANCPNKKILQTKFIKVFVRTKWDSLWWFIFLFTILLWVNVVIMSILIVTAYLHFYSSPITLDYLWLVSIFVICNLILGIYEALQAIMTGIQYFNSFWNIVDIIRLVLCFSWSVLSFLYSQDQLYFLTWFMTVLNFFRGLTGFRSFDSTRFYTRLIIRAFVGAMPFIMIFFYSTFAFGVVYFTSLAGHEDNIFKLWQAPYQLNMGDIEAIDQQKPMQYLYFMMASVINVIIMLNLLISILGDSFDSFQVDAEQIDCLEMTELVLELETLMYWNKDANQKSYLQICKNLEVEGTGEWEGRVKAIFMALERLRKDSNTHSINIDQKLKKIENLLMQKK
ncbi:hypothetical protein SteCoe_20208 [Stentor coeruleus]|uniref:Uncharacterized protein n=1 Tax=Stentor coeruleus TaxID=5963 RepID=A0A1R2BSE6_9CILI|nr:hypothetical protein SteCoe_20208 [Stentor coeruleus]